jgi:branched-chain amino acid transport system substrate-binding protein
MISSDRVQLFDSGCVSAGNFAAAGSVVQAKIPNLTCGVLPPSPEQRKWMFGMRLPGRFELDVRLAYLRDHTAIRQIGVLHDSTPYSQIQRDLALKTAGDYGITVVDTQFYNQDDADLSVQIAHMRAAGAAAILKIGTGGSTLTAAKNIVQLGLSMPLLASSDDLSTFRAATAALGDKFFFAAAPAQAVDALPPGPAKDAVEAFLKIWSAEYGERDGSVAAHAWDSIMLLAQAIAAANSSDGTAIRDAMERLPPYQGAGGLYEFTPEDHEVKLNALRLVQIRDGHVVLAQ